MDGRVVGTGDGDVDEEGAMEDEEEVDVEVPGTATGTPPGWHRNPPLVWTHICSDVHVCLPDLHSSPVVSAVSETPTKQTTFGASSSVLSVNSKRLAPLFKRLRLMQNGSEGNLCRYLLEKPSAAAKT